MIDIIAIACLTMIQFNNDGKYLVLIEPVRDIFSYLLEKNMSTITQQNNRILCRQTMGLTL